MIGAKERPYPTVKITRSTGQLDGDPRSFLNIDMSFLASKGQWLVVLSPQSVAEEVMDIHREALAKYESLQSSSLGAP